MTATNYVIYGKKPGTHEYTKIAHYRIKRKAIATATRYSKIGWMDVHIMAEKLLGFMTEEHKLYGSKRR